MKLLRAAPLSLLLLIPALACQPKSAGESERPAGVETTQYAEGATIPLTSNNYGRFAAAPEALKIGDKAPDFQLPLTSDERFQLSTANPGGDVVIVFYRGFW